MVFDVASQSWAVAPLSPYDGGWGDGMEYVADRNAVFVIDGRTSGGMPQGTAGLLINGPDLNSDGAVGFQDLVVLLAQWGACEGCPCLADFDGSGDVGLSDLLTVLASWG